MFRLPALAVLVVLASPAAAYANPSVTVSSSRVGSTAKLPATVRHTLALTAGATAEALTVSVSPSARIVVTGVPAPPLGPQTGGGLRVCEGKWTSFHEAYKSGPNPDDLTFTIPPGQTATLTADVVLAHAPWPDESLDATWSIQPAQGSEFDVLSKAPLFSGPIGVELSLQATRVPGGDYVVSGTASPDVDSGHVEVWAYAPGAKHARRVARVPVRDGEWAYNRFAPSRGGNWELYARYRSAGKAFANDATECGTKVSVTETS